MWLQRTTIVWKTFWVLIDTVISYLLKPFHNTFLDTIPYMLLPEKCITCMALATVISITWCNCFYNCCENPQNIPVRCLFELLWKMTPFKDTFKSFYSNLSSTNQKTRLGGCFWKVLSNFNWFKFFSVFTFN